MQTSIEDMKIQDALIVDRFSIKICTFVCMSALISAASFARDAKFDM